MSYYCEICGDYADVHHIVHRSEGGLDFKLNYKYLCKKHHRSKIGPHRDKVVDLNYKLETLSVMIVPFGASSFKVPSVVVVVAPSSPITVLVAVPPDAAAALAI